MTQPTPAPGAPATPPAPAPTPQPTPTPAPTPQPQPTSRQPTPPSPTGQDPSKEPVDVNALPANVQALIKDLRAEAAKNRVDPKTAAAEARADMARQVAVALGLESEEPTVEELTEQIEAAQGQAWRAAVELQVHQHGGPNAAALLDSMAFISSLEELIDDDPFSDEFRTKLQAKVQEAAAKYSATPAPGAPNGPRPDPSQGARGTPPATRPMSLSEAFAAHYKR